jgi:hypothetical protein
MSIKNLKKGQGKDEWEAELILCPRFVQLRCTRDKLPYAVIEFRRGVGEEEGEGWVSAREEACMKVWELLTN